MTANQIQYWKNTWDRLLKEKEQNETKRHNVAMERYNQAALDETKRQNIAYIDETKRHNLEQELIGALQSKASLASASAAQTSAAAAYRQAATREAELIQQKWVDEQVQSRQDKLAEAQYSDQMASAQLKEAQAGLVTMQSITEGYKAQLVSAETARTAAETTLTERRSQTEVANTARAWVGVAQSSVDTVKGFVSLVTLPALS